LGSEYAISQYGVAAPCFMQPVRLIQTKWFGVPKGDTSSTAALRFGFKWLLHIYAARNQLRQ
jgi:hypothetical protein